MGFDVFDQSTHLSMQEPGEQVVEEWYRRMVEEALRRKAEIASSRRVQPRELETLAREVFRTFSEQALAEGVRLPGDFLPRLIGEVSGLGPLLVLAQDPQVEDLAVNYGHMYVFRTGEGWMYYGPTPPGFGDALRVLLDAENKRPPSPEQPIADAQIQVTVPVDQKSTQRVGLRVNFIMPPASPYGDVITIRFTRYPRTVPEKPLSLVTANRLPPVRQPPFQVQDLPDGQGVLSPEAANYLLAVLYHGAPVVVAGATGSGKTFLARLLLQHVLNMYPRGALRLFIIEDTSEIVLNAWSGDPSDDTGNVVYTLTRPAPVGEGPPPITMYDLIRAALRSRPHGIVVGEARGAEAWELIRATATGHGYSVFSIHATSADKVWPRFLQAVQAHPDVQHLKPLDVARAFAEGVAVVVFLARTPQHGQVALEIAEVSPIVEDTAARPAFNRLFVFDEADLGLPANTFMHRRWL